MKISTILDQIDNGALALPEFQRGYVWNRDQVRGLMDSLYRQYPVGSLLVWLTKTENASARGDAVLQPGTVKLLLDGQQRITSLYGIIRGKAPRFFDGNTDAFTGLHFHLDDEVFEFYAPMKMKYNLLWVNVTDLMQRDIGEFIQRLMAVPELLPNVTTYINRLTAITHIKDIDLHIEEVSGEDKTVGIVVSIFNKVNSGGTKLSKGDLALAKICAEWPEARSEMKKRLAKWRQAGFHFRLEWLLRNITTVVTGSAFFDALEHVDTPTFQRGLTQAEDAVDRLLNIMAARLGLDHDLVLSSRGAFPLLARYITMRDGRLTDARERDKLLYWYVHTFLWGRYSGSTESMLSQDLRHIEDPNGALDRLIGQLRQNRGDLRILPDDFQGYSRAARFYPVLYMLTRAAHARDWGTGAELSHHLLGRLSRLELHHIFPKAVLYKHGYSRGEVNALANFTFLTQETNLLVSDRLPEIYLADFAAQHPGALESTWIPMDPTLWKVERYRDFLAERRRLLAAATHELLDSLLGGTIPDVTEPTLLVPQGAATPGGVSSDDEMNVLIECNAWLAERGLPEGEFLYELVAPDTGNPLATLDLAWPNGLQEGYSQPVALLIDEGEDTEQAANQAGFRYFTDLNAFKQYVAREIVAVPAIPA
ncbi:MAG TPA: DUF262 domain-containing protein [Armatimonadota bacterium]|nr:DUF262 domain-containing protein [Armatimonadota bacterium]